MSDALINWFVVNLGGKVGKELILFIISMVPILELRGGLLAAGPTFLNIPMWRAIPVSYTHLKDQDAGGEVQCPFVCIYDQRTSTGRSNEKKKF